MRCTCLSFALLSTAALALSLSACEITASEGEGEGEGEPQVVKVTITAAEGGTITDATGKAALVIPAGALAEDTEITLTTTPAENGSEGDRYEFGPSGLEFVAPATLSVTFTGTPPEDKVAALAVYESGTTWTPLANGVVDGDTVSGDVEHFSTFSIVFVDGQVIITSECADTVTNFTACGGDIVGEWQFQDICIAALVISENPYEQVPGCEDTVFEFGFDIDATFTVTETTTQGSAATNTSTRHLNMAQACIDLLAEGEACADFTNVDGFFELDEGETGSCAVVGTRCDCTATKVEEKPAGEPTPYTIDNTTHEIVSTDTDGNEQRSPYCVVGDEFQVGDIDDNGDVSSVVVLTPAT